jgi:hypothetical protein
MSLYFPGLRIETWGHPIDFYQHLRDSTKSPHPMDGGFWHF